MGFIHLGHRRRRSCKEVCVRNDAIEKAKPKH